VVRSSNSQYAAAGTDPPWPPLLKGGKLGATHAEGNHRSPDREFSTAQAIGMTLGTVGVMPSPERLCGRLPQACSRGDRRPAAVTVKR
jgi:hypothetical protein